MMEQRGFPLLVGAFIVGFVVLITGFVLWLGKLEFDEDIYIYDIYVDGSVTGLSEGERVRYRGVPIGTVKKISVDSHNLKSIKVTIGVQNPDLIREDTVASLETSGITGIAFVQINGGSTQRPPLKALPGQENPVIMSQPSRLEEVFQRVPQVLLKIQEVSDNLNAVLDKENRGLIKDTLQNINTLSTHLNESLGRLEDTFASGFQRLEKTAAQADATLGSLDRFIKDNHSNVQEFTTTGLPELTELIEDSKHAVGDISKAAHGVEQSVKRLIDHDIQRGRMITP